MSTDRVDVGRGPAQHAGGSPNGSEPVEDASGSLSRLLNAEVAQQSRRPPSERS